MYHRQHNEHYNRSEDIEKIIQELEEENIEHDVLDDYDSDDDPNFGPEVIKDPNHDSDSEVELDSPFTRDEIEGNLGENFCFFIGKDGETLWTNEPVENISKQNKKHYLHQDFSWPKRSCSSM